MSSYLPEVLHEPAQTWNLSKSLHRQGFSGNFFYPKERKLRQMSNRDKTAKNHITT